MNRLPARLALALAALLLGGAPAPAADSLEYAIKAAYLYKFAPFVQWPADAFATPTSAINICILGSDPFGPALDQAVTGEKVGGRPLSIRHIAAVAPDSNCQILFTGAARDAAAPDDIAAVRGRPVLTVADAGSGAAPHSIVTFVVVNNRVRFSIDEQAAAQSRLAISSKLLSLAVPARP